MSKDSLKNIEWVSTWLEDNYKPLNERFDTMKQTLELAQLRFESPLIVETGCVRQVGDWGAGQSTLVFADYLRKSGSEGRLTSVDNDESNISVCKSITLEWSDITEVVCSDSVEYLQSLPADRMIDLLYLDSWDYPYGELLNVYGGKTDITEAIRILGSMTDEEVVELHLDIIQESQNHCLKEIRAALPHLHDESIILIDDNKLPGGGKPRLAKIELKELGYVCLQDDYQTLWIKE